jgi:hypothetical protein
MMTLISTQKTQNTRPGDFSWVPEGELVVSGASGMCDNHKLYREGELSRCGCDRAFRGIESRKGTTTVEVAETSLTREEIIEKHTEGLIASWGDDPDVRVLAIGEVDEMLAVAADLPLGTVMRQDARSMFTHG